MIFSRRDKTRGSCFHWENDGQRNCLFSGESTCLGAQDQPQERESNKESTENDGAPVELFLQTPSRTVKAAAVSSECGSQGRASLLKQNENHQKNGNKNLCYGNENYNVHFISYSPPTQKRKWYGCCPHDKRGPKQGKPSKLKFRKQEIQRPHEQQVNDKPG